MLLEELWDGGKAMMVFPPSPNEVVDDEVKFWVEKWKFWKWFRMRLEWFLWGSGYVQTSFKYNSGDVGLHLYELFERKPGWRFTARSTYQSYTILRKKGLAIFDEKWHFVKKIWRFY